AGRHDRGGRPRDRRRPTPGAGGASRSMSREPMKQPVGESRPTTAHSAHLREPYARGMGLSHLLVVEDDADIGFELRDALVGHGFTVDWAATAAEAERCAVRQHPDL